MYNFHSFILLDVPEAPDAPKIVAVKATSMDLTWTPPSSDGGSPITAYNVERKEAFSTRWVAAEQVMGTSCTVTGLKEGTEYQFRVTAINKAGLGKPSGPSDARIAKPPYGMYHCTLGNSNFL